MLTAEQAGQVVAVVERELLTPLGLRSLAAGDPQYVAHYEGGPWERDRAYHQGTVWAWLMGPFITAYIKVNGQNPNGVNEARARAVEWLGAFQEHLSMAGLNHVSEIFDADAPHAARGCVAQAWSVAELLRCAVEDVFAITPASGERAAAN
jgi:glycogen debranching enzyme